MGNLTLKATSHPWLLKGLVTLSKNNKMSLIRVSQRISNILSKPEFVLVLYVIDHAFKLLALQEKLTNCSKTCYKNKY